MPYVAFSHWPIPLLPACRIFGRAVAIGRRRWGIREFLCSGVGEFMGLQVGMEIGLHLVTTDLLPVHWHHTAWYLALSLGALAGGAGGWYLARLSREAPTPQEPANA